MSLAIKYENVDDARMRLRNSVVLYKNDPVLITDVIRGEGDEILRVKFNALPVQGLPVRNNPFGEVRRKEQPKDDAEERKYISSKHFDIAPFELGYVNATRPFYCTRLPNRIQKQGLCAENFKGCFNNGGGASWALFLASPETTAMIKGDYPTFEQAAANVHKKKEIAFSRYFCLVQDEVIPDLLFLYYKGSKIGFLQKKEVTLGKNYECLKESLEELNVKIGVC